MKNNQTIPKKQLIKFLGVSLVGISAFMVPFTYNGSINTCVGIVTDWIKALLNGLFVPLIVILLTLSAVFSMAEYIFIKIGKEKQGKFHTFFKTTPIYVVTKILAAIVAWCFWLGFGSQVIIGDSTGGTMIGLGKTLIAIAVALSYVLPFLTDGGLMEFAGVITKPFVRPLFKVPSDASLDLIASWLGASSAAVILSAEKYKRGYYTKKEAAIVMCNFSLVSIPFCMVVATTAGVDKYFPVMYGTLCLLGIVLAIVMPRIYPLNKLSNNYYEESTINGFKSENTGLGLFRQATLESCKAVENFHLKVVLKSGTNVLTSICFNLLPVVIAWGTIGLIVVEYTPILHWISIPFGWILDIMGVAEAYAVAPATLAGFVDMFIPCLLVVNVASVETRFIIATLSLIQIIYITEVGAVIIQTNLGIDIKKLFVIFIERTLISLPIIILVGKLIL